MDKKHDYIAIAEAPCLSRMSVAILEHSATLNARTP